MKVFSYSIYYGHEKYCRGLWENLKTIRDDFPDFGVFIYRGEDVPQEWIDRYETFPFVRVFETTHIGHDTMVDRFFAIDEPGVEVALIRDADSRIHARDRWCIRHFMESPYTFTTTRDHPYHTTAIMGCAWGIKKMPALSIRELYGRYNDTGRIHNRYQHDQEFLRDALFPLIKNNCIVYVLCDKMRWCAEETIHIIPFPIQEHEFCGQVYLFDSQGKEYKEFQFSG